MGVKSNYLRNGVSLHVLHLKPQECGYRGGDIEIGDAVEVNSVGNTSSEAMKIACILGSLFT